MKLVILIICQIVEVNNAKEVANILKQESKILDENHIKVYVKKEEVPEIIKQLVEKGLSIYSVKQEELSLEDVFLKKTGGNVID